MTRRDRLMATLRGEKTDRPPVCFYELNGIDEDIHNPDPFNIYNDPSWRPLLELARDRTDRIAMRTVAFHHEPNAVDQLTSTKIYYDENGSRHNITEIKAGDRVLRQHTRRDKDINTVWALEHFVKDEDDLRAWIDLPHDGNVGIPDCRPVLEAEKVLGDTGIALIDSSDALCEIAALMSMEDYTVIAMTAPELFEQALNIAQVLIEKKVEILSKELPGRLWRIYGPEYATPPYLPPALYERYVVNYDRPLTKLIKSTGGFPRLHEHGRMKAVLDLILKTGCTAVDPIEPAPQGDVTLAEVREKTGGKLVLFGNLEISDIEQLSPDEMEKKVLTAIQESGGSRFVLMPSASPYGRKLSPLTLANYTRIVETVENYRY
ncbi:MAG TPA: uroporphyrinogen decarboxylase family protein [Oscillospiraceae bacterium]|mgnify:CR=1 FL=1|nr:uroporphyrinogen decarboxylase family protein [Oscillospiraceae bacterium]HPS34272.1 uroporphyrinogen decarboxylase family protein [Oscillospiraceae bacterium]